MTGALDKGALRVSIHAPAWGATSGLGALGKSSTVFQSTRPHGARPYHLNLLIIKR